MASKRNARRKKQREANNQKGQTPQPPETNRPGDVTTVYVQGVSGDERTHQATPLAKMTHGGEVGNGPDSDPGAFLNAAWRG
jgi:hypothetical protein